ncbi:MAG TPA: hypothetical protein VM261_34585 [Kofleriaceae bacterium]|nr:hypothetical protein [Kofleriaceae bacterium]
MKLRIAISLSLSASILPFAACVSSGPPELETAVAELEASWCTAHKLDAFSSDADEGRLVFTPDGRTAYFHRFVDGRQVILESRRTGSGWSTPAPVPFATPFDEFDAFVTPDGRTLYYTSFRSLDGASAQTHGDIWKVTRTAAGWGAPVRLGPEVNTDANEFFPSTTADGTLFFNSDREGGAGAWDLWRARRNGSGFRTAENLPGGVNTDIWEFNPSPSPGGRLLAFGSLDPDPAAPYSDIFFAVKVGGAYSERVPAPYCVNGEGEEYHPTLDVAGGRLIFVRRDPFHPVTGGDFYEVRLPGAFWRD